MSTLSKFQRGSIAAALYRMLTGEKFSICTVRSSLRAARPDFHPDGDPIFNSLRLWNTVRFGEMPAGASDQVKRHTLSLFALCFDCADVDELRRAAGLPDADDSAQAETAPAQSGDSGSGALVPVPAPHGWSHVIA